MKVIVMSSVVTEETVCVCERERGRGGQAFGDHDKK